MMDWILNFVAGLAFISLAAMGFAIVSIIFMRWLQNNTSSTFELLATSSEQEIDQLRDEAIGDMFDHARETAMQRQVGGEQR